MYFWNELVFLLHIITSFYFSRSPPQTYIVTQNLCTEVQNHSTWGSKKPKAMGKKALRLTTCACNLATNVREKSNKNSFTGRGQHLPTTNTRRRFGEPVNTKKTFSRHFKASFTIFWRSRPNVLLWEVYSTLVRNGQSYNFQVNWRMRNLIIS